MIRRFVAALGPLAALGMAAACSSSPSGYDPRASAGVQGGTTADGQEAGAAADGGAGGDASFNCTDDAATGAKGDAARASDGARPDARSDAAPDAGSPVFSGVWTSVSYGVTRSDLEGGGDDVAIVYGGYTATDADSQGWVTALTAARLAALGVGHMVAVRGPKDPDYNAREIGNSELATLLSTLTAGSKRVVVLAHSSGGFVADELFTFVSSAVMAKMTYFNLDGGSWALTDAMVGAMRGVYFCGAHDAVAGYSENWSSDESLHSDFPASHLYLVDADGSGCDVGAGWCMHDTLIIDRPHDPSTYDLALDYTDFTNGRHVVTAHLDQAVADGTL